MFDCTLSFSRFPTTIMQTHNAFTHHTLHAFADDFERKRWFLAAKLATTITVEALDVIVIVI